MHVKVSKKDKPRMTQEKNGSGEGFAARQVYPQAPDAAPAAFEATNAGPVQRMILRESEGAHSRPHAGKQETAAGQDPVQRKLIFDDWGDSLKLGELKGALRALGGETKEWGLFQDDKNIHLILEIDEGSGPNPAEISNPLKNLEIPGVWAFRLKIKRWFIDSNPIGKVIGILNHEIGVHALPYIGKLRENIASELETGELKHPEDDLTSQESGGIDDHRRAMQRGTDEFQQYLDLALSSANLMSKTGAEAKEESLEVAGVDIVFSYLMDLAAMEANGNKGKIAMKGMIPNPYREETFAYVLRRYNEYAKELPDEWQKKIPAMTTRDVEKAFLDFRAQVPKTKAVVSVLGLLLLICLVVLVLRSRNS